LTNRLRLLVNLVVRTSLVALSLCFGWPQTIHAELRVAFDTKLTASWSEGVTMSGIFRPNELYDCRDSATGKSDHRFVDRQSGREVNLLGVDFGMNPFPFRRAEIGSALDVRIDDDAIKWVEIESGLSGRRSLSLSIDGYGVALIDIDNDGSEEIVVNAPCGDRGLDSVQVFEWTPDSSGIHEVMHGSAPVFFPDSPNRVEIDRFGGACLGEVETLVFDGDRYRWASTEKFFPVGGSCYRARLDSEFTRSLFDSIEDNLGHGVHDLILRLTIAQPTDN
jgi:hypothetical protein